MVHMEKMLRNRSFLVICCIGIILLLSHNRSRDQLSATFLRERQSLNDQTRRFVNNQTTTEGNTLTKIKLLCWVMTSSDSVSVKGIHAQHTWGKRCDKFVFASDTFEPDYPSLNISVQTGRDHLTAKTMQAFDQIWKHHSEYDWFLKADDDTFIVVENLKYFLSVHSPAEKVYFGHHFTPWEGQGYHSGGAGYVISRAALQQYGERNRTLCSEDFGPEDVEFGKCMEAIGVKTGDTRDSLGRSRFHCFTPHAFLSGDILQGWYKNYTKYWAEGEDSVSDYAISFHYITPKLMHELDFFLYRLRPRGLWKGVRDTGPDINNPPPPDKKFNFTKGEFFEESNIKYY